MIARKKETYLLFEAINRAENYHCFSLKIENRFDETIEFGDQKILIYLEIIATHLEEARAEWAMENG